MPAQVQVAPDILGILRLQELEIEPLVLEPEFKMATEGVGHGVYSLLRQLFGWPPHFPPETLFFALGRGLGGRPRPTATSCGDFAAKFSIK